MKITKKNLLIYILAGVLVLGGDLVTKFIVAARLEVGASCELVKNFFYFTFVKNEGAAWGIMTGQQTFLIIISLLAGALMVYYFMKSDEHEALLRFGLVLAFCGMLGNLYDRVFLGYVRDFIDVFIFGYDFPVFNVADMGVVIGLGLVIVELIMGEYAQWKFNQSHPLKQN